MDKRKNYYMVLDTETANDFDDPIVYDMGASIIDKKGNVYETVSLIIYDTFFEMEDLMKTAYYADKRGAYLEEINQGLHKIVRYSTAKKIINDLATKWNIKAIMAHNAPFDYRSTTRTQRYLTKSKSRYFLPYGIELWDTLKMARDTIGKTKSYRLWCNDNGYITKNGQPRFTAEILYRYLSGEDEFIESHTGLADTLIEKEIFAHCLRFHKPMRKKAFED